MKKNLTLLLTVLFSCTLSAQTISEYQKKQKAEMQKFQQANAEGTNQLQKEYADFVSKRDAEWADYLRKEWEQFSVFAGKGMPLKPKPRTIPTYLPPVKPLVPQPNAPAIKPIVVQPVVVVPKPTPPPVAPICKPAEDVINGNTANINFYGRSFSFVYDAALAKCALSTVSKEGITAFWESTSACNYTPTVEKLQNAKLEMKINDYGYFLLTQKLAKNLYPENENTSRLLTWFLLVRSGYGVRVAIQQNEVVLLVPSNQQIYQNSFLTIGGVNYYIFPKGQGGSLFTYDKDYASTAQGVNLNFSNSIYFAGRKTEKSLSFNFDNKPYTIHVDYDPDLIEFFKSYPQAEFSVYFNAATSAQAKQSLVSALKPYTSQMDELKAVNFLLHFVQTAFEYKTDNEQFAREKYFFAEELFYYPYSDCEDRSVLFSYLVREIMGLSVIGLNYPNHMATAVAFTANVNGDYMMYKNKRYVVSDPTYINANVGMSMPQFKGVSPLVIDID
jgi:hypothetical protein